jgi:tetratricopeptide (TPR) repeat protein
MSTHPSLDRPLELVPIDEPAAADKPQEAPPAGAHPEQPDDAVPRVDRFLARVAAEYRAGRIDQPLWAHVLAQSGGHEKTARSAYLRARATAIQVADRNRAAPTAAGAATGSAHPTSEPARQSSAGAALERLRSTPWMWGAVGGVLAAVIVGVVLIATRKDPAPAASVVPARPPAAVARATTRPPVDTTLASASATEPSLESRVNDLIAARNWNVVVLTATEWTRKEPRNSSAWMRLGVGYAHLGQLDEAFDAARKATDVAPGDAAAWRNLGEANVARNQPAAALAAYEKAAALDERDLSTLARVGMLNAQRDRLPEAKDAFDKVLAARADDTDALCGQAFVARQQGRRKDADAIVRDLKASDRMCKELSDALGMPQFASPATKASARH